MAEILRHVNILPILMPTSCMCIYIFFQVVVIFNNIHYDDLQHIRIEGLTYNVGNEQEKATNIIMCTETYKTLSCS